MRAFVALIKREYLEHRLAFVVAPMVLIGLMLAAALYGMVGHSVDASFSDGPSSALRLYEALLSVTVAGWWLYLLVTLMFYYANAFSADSRNNAMLFWKSMPQSDLKILSSKVAAGLTIFPAAILVATVLTALIAYLPTYTVANLLAGFSPPSAAEVAVTLLNVVAIATMLFVTSLLWYLPFYGWIGLLGTVFGRWSIPLSVLIPGVISLFEAIAMRNFERSGGYVWRFLENRLTFNVDAIDLEAVWEGQARLQAGPVITQMLMQIDWIAMAGGLAVAVLLIYAASEYRRRCVLT
ncbi:hypothetical protein [Pelagibacterium xiamenense]|uniref:hypothetical protein n=1 Tax=Pelagibacterium xiamenense TaxID=2901140 RepID=UPI001E3B4AB6|nr:hypothetical protein [Pelagibacterium xiamenense]MCD7058974.1 hypothetical protein [Pelagibacterium xiamenense]